jgi:GH25 family lysozyme M1 (1,4-beta-N-acetylmuramidase)
MLAKLADLLWRLGDFTSTALRTMSRRRRRVWFMVLVLLSSAVWAAGSAPAFVVGGRVHPDPANLTAATQIRAERPAAYPVGGIDISHHDHRFFAPHWSTEIAAGTQFVYIKATEGATYVNPNFAADYAAARRAGQYVGAYVYARPDLGRPEAQADHFLRHAKFTRDATTLVPMVDLEWPYAGVKADDCYNLTVDQLRAWIRAFIGRIEKAIGRKPMIYTNTHWWNPCTGNDPSYGSYPLDIANYSKKPIEVPAGWSTFALWQYAPGDPSKAHSHDRDVVNGGLAGLRALAWPPVN